VFVNIGIVSGFAPVDIGFENSKIIRSGWSLMAMIFGKFTSSWDLILDPDILVVTADDAVQFGQFIFKDVIPSGLLPFEVHRFPGGTILK
jgi:hypothetical protein